MSAPKFYRFNKETGQEQQCEFNASHLKQANQLGSGAGKIYELTRLWQLELVNVWNRQGLHNQWEYYL